MPKIQPVWLTLLLSAGACDANPQPSQPSSSGVSRPPGAASGPVSGGMQGPSSMGAGATPSGASGPPPAFGTAGEPSASIATSSGRSLMWKRYAAFEADLMRGLELKREEVCVELGDRSCTRDIHIIALGGNDPFRSGIHRPSAEPTATTAVAVDRVLLSACGARARADKAGSAKVFTAIDLRGPAPAAEAPGVQTTIRDLYRRLLTRDPRPHETQAVKSLLDPSEPDPLQSAEEFAMLACYAIGSSVEFLFD